MPSKRAILFAPITPDNLKQVFDKWVVMIGREIKGIARRRLCAACFLLILCTMEQFLPTITLTAELMHKNGAPVFSLRRKNL
jgi:hypothetical protein